MIKHKNDPDTLRGRLERGSIWEPNSGCLLWEGAAHAYGHGKIGIRIGKVRNGISWREQS